MQRSRDAALEVFVAMETLGELLAFGSCYRRRGSLAAEHFLSFIPGSVGPPVAVDAAHRRQRPLGERSELLHHRQLRWLDAAVLAARAAIGVF